MRNVKKRLKKKLREAQKLMYKQLSGRYAQTVARRIYTYGDYSFFYNETPKTNFRHKYAVVPCMDYGVGFDGEEYEVETEYFALNRIGG